MHRERPLTRSRTPLPQVTGTGLSSSVVASEAPKLRPPTQSPALNKYVSLSSLDGFRFSNDLFLKRMGMSCSLLLGTHESISRCMTRKRAKRKMTKEGLKAALLAVGSSKLATLSKVEVKRKVVIHLPNPGDLERMKTRKLLYGRASEPLLSFAKETQDAGMQNESHLGKLMHRRADSRHHLWKSEDFS